MTALATPVGSSAPAAPATPATPNTPAVVATAPAGQGTTPPASANVPAAGTTGAPAAAPANAPPSTPVADPRAEINQLAEQFGFDPTMFAPFNDTASAKAAIKLYSEQMAQQGMSALMQPQMPQAGNVAQQFGMGPQQTATPAVPELKPLDLKALGLTDDDPAAKAVRAIEAQLAERDKAIQAMQQKFQQAEQTAAESNRQQLQAQAAQVVDGFADARYGVGNQRTAAQKLAVAKLYDLADAILIGELQAGRHPSPVNVRLARARLLDAVENGSPIPAPATPTPATVGALPQTSPGPAPSTPGMKINEKWSQNPELRRALNLP